MLTLVGTPMVVVSTDVVKDMINSKKLTLVIIGYNLVTATQLLTYITAIIISTDVI